MKYKVLLYVILAMANCYTYSSFYVEEVRKDDKHDIAEVCLLFEDETNMLESCIDPKDISAIVHGDRYRTLVCKKDSRVVGMLSFAYQEKGLEKCSRSVPWTNVRSGYRKTDADSIWYSSIAIHPDYRRQGVATELMKKAERFCIELGVKNIILWVYRKNRDAITCCEKQGFLVLEEVRDSYKMYKFLSYVDSPLYFLEKAKTL